MRVWRARGKRGAPSCGAHSYGPRTPRRGGCRLHERRPTGFISPASRRPRARRDGCRQLGQLPHFTTGGAAPRSQPSACERPPGRPLKRCFGRRWTAGSPVPHTKGDAEPRRPARPSERVPPRESFRRRGATPTEPRRECRMSPKVQIVGSTREWTTEFRRPPTWRKRRSRFARRPVPAHSRCSGTHRTCAALTR